MVQRDEGAADGFQREAVSQACGLCNGLFWRQGGVHIQQWSGSQHGDLKKAAVGYRVLSGYPDCFSCAWESLQQVCLIRESIGLYGNLRRIAV